MWQKLNAGVHNVDSFISSLLIYQANDPTILPYLCMCQNDTYTYITYTYQILKKSVTTRNMLITL